ncbi:MAG: WXG100 family type VII secretion target [Bifidobacterium asteroides]
MSLHVEWSVIGYAADPVPGDPDGVGVCAARLRDKKESVDSLVAVLNRIVPDKGGSVFVGDAADQYAKKLSHFPEDMKNLSQGLASAYDTLNSWKSSMDRCQWEAHRAYDDARQALENMHAAEVKLDDASASARSAQSAEFQMRLRQKVGQDVSKADEKETVSRVQRAEKSVADFRTQVNSAQDSYRAAMKRLDSISDEYSEKARATGSSLRGYLEELPSASWWERVYYSSAWSVIVKVAEIGSMIFGIAALILGGGGIIGILAFAFAAIGFINDWMAHSEGDESDSEFALSFASLLLAGFGLKGVGKSLSKGLELFQSGGKMSVLSKLRLLGDPTKQGGYLVSHFSTMMGRPNGILPVSKWVEGAKSLAATSPKRMSTPMLWMKGFGRGVWSSAKAAGTKAYDAMLYTYAKFDNEGLKFVARDAGEAAAKVKGFIAKNDGVQGALAAVRKNPLYGTVTRGIRSVVQDDVDALKRQVHNSEQKSGGWKTTVSEGLGYLKPLSPMAGPLGTVLSSL